MKFTTTLLPLFSLLASALARSSTGDRVLVVRDNKYESGYNKFFESLKGESESESESGVGSRESGVGSRGEVGVRVRGDRGMVICCWGVLAIQQQFLQIMTK
jgi:hypothetical protein